MLGIREYNDLDLKVYHPKEGRADQSIGLPGINRWSTIGDMHGNALKFLDFVHLEDIANILAIHYQQFVQDYDDAQTKAVQDKDVQNEGAEENAQEKRVNAVKHFYREVLPFITVIPGTNFRAIGDLLGDRGANDFFTLLLIGKLIDGGANVEIILSNHDSFFIQWMEAKLEGRRVEPWKAAGAGQAESLRRLDELVELGVVQMDHLTKLYNQYKQTLKLLSYDYNERGEFVLYSHAHLDERGVLAMAEGLLDWYKDMNPGVKDSLTALCDRLAAKPNEMISEEDTKALVDLINAVVKESASKNKLTGLVNLSSVRLSPEQHRGKGIDPAASPIFYALWNRDDIDRKTRASPDPRPKNPAIINTHGHHTYSQEFAVCLDNPLGKFDNTVGALTYTRTSPVNVLKIKHAQLTEMLQFLISRGNIVLQKDLQTGVMDVKTNNSVNNPEVNRICFHLMSCFDGMKLDENPTQHVEKINEAWASIDHLIMQERNPGLGTKMKREWNDKVTARSAGPKATTNQLIDHWSVSKEKHIASAMATMPQHQNRLHN